ncbi:MAG: type IV secretion system protein VirB10 [Neisseriaceae bacterium]|nr:type IV secretion system protein VirB10 [Neisseriaceae bacterium]
MSINLDPKHYENNSIAPVEENNEEVKDYTQLDHSKQQGDGDENGGRAAPQDQSDSSKNNAKLVIGGLGIFVAFAFLIIAFISWKGKEKPAQQKVEKAKVEVSSEKVKRHTFPDTLPPKPQIDLGENQTQSPQIAGTTNANMPVVDNSNTTMPDAPPPAEEPKIDPILERRLGGGVLVNDGSNIGQPEQGNTAQASYGGGVPQGFGSESNSNERSLNFTGTTFAVRVASKRGDRTLLLAKGTTIPCVLVTKSVTDHAGLTKCQATKNVWSANGKTVLFERGTIFMGEQTAAMLQGQARVAVRWTQAETPKGVIVDIDSPSVGQLGASGNPAWVNHHFWKRFGGSIMISLIGDFSNGLSKRISRKSGSNDFTLEESADNMDEMATEALRNSINIPPTGTINQGALLNIMVARDIDFSQVYDRVDISEFDSLLP